MQEKAFILDEAVHASQEGTLLTEQFLEENYLFRRNILNGKVEFATLPTEDPVYRTLTQEALNTIIIQAKRDDFMDGANPKTEIIEIIHSDFVPVYDPIRDFLEKLPQWDGKNHVAHLFGRIPGISSEQHGFLTIWLRSAVAHWLQMDTLHGNECVPTLIGSQGCGKTTFMKRLLPPNLRQYFLDHLNLSNKFDKEMALTNNLLVNLDELDAIRPSQHASLKQTLSKSKVNGRPIFGCCQEDRARYASFVATTNNPHPLTDATGSRRYICLTIPRGQLIDNTGEIDYEQLYAQVLHEIRELNAPYWYNSSEVERIQQLNLNYMEQKDIADIIEVCFKKPHDGEGVRMNTCEILKTLQKEYPSVRNDHSTKVHLGIAMKELGYEHTLHSNRVYYRVLPHDVA